MPEVVRAERLTKVYRGGARGVDDVDFEVRQSEVFGFLGPNGAGKTTTIRLLLDLIRPTAGRLSVFGLDSRRDSLEIRRRLGYVPGGLRLYDRLTARELLEYFAALRNLRGLGDGLALAERLELELDRPLRTLSSGNRQKAGLVQAFMHRPDLLVLDEPTSGLDPLVQQTFHELVRETAADGRTVLLLTRAGRGAGARRPRRSAARRPRRAGRVGRGASCPRLLECRGDVRLATTAEALSRPCRGPAN